MNSDSRFCTLMLTAALLLVASQAPAVTIHSWVDDQGVQHFADSAPAAEDSTQIEFSDAALGSAVQPGDDYYSITNQWARLNAERNQNRQRELARQRIANERRALSEPASVQIQDRRISYPLFAPFPRGFGRGFDRAGHHHRRAAAIAPSNRGDYLQQRRRSGFTPSGAPGWPRQR